MRREGDAPTEVTDYVVDALFTSMTCSFHGVARKRTEGGHAVTGPEEDGVGGVADVIGSGISASS